MRIEPLIGTKVWFKPRTGVSWGWAPASWEGWAMTGVALTTAALTARGPNRTPRAIAIAAAVVAAGIAKGTSPGGRGAAAEYERVRGSAR